MKFLRCLPSSLATLAALSPISMLAAGEAEMIGDLADPSNAYDYVILTPAEFSTQCLGLGQHISSSPRHGSPLLDVGVATAEEVELRFGNGQPGLEPAEVRAFMEYVWSSWLRRPRYLLLVGDPETNDGEVIIPSPELTGPVTGYPDCYDDYYACLDGPDDITPNLAVGRLPAFQPGQVANYLERLQAFDALDPNVDWRRRMLATTYDRDLNQNGHLVEGQALVAEMSRLLAGLPAGFLACGDTTHLRRSECGWEYGGHHECRDAALAVVNSGVLLWMGLATQQGAGAMVDFVYPNYEAGLIANGDRLPLILAFSCRSAVLKNQDDFLGNSLGSSWTQMSGMDGCIGWIGPSGATRQHEAVLALETFLQEMADAKPYVAETNVGVGDLLMRTKRKILQEHPAYESVRSYILIGDPSVWLPLRGDFLEATSIEGPSPIHCGDAASYTVSLHDDNYAVMDPDRYAYSWRAQHGTLNPPLGEPTVTYYVDPDYCGEYGHKVDTISVLVRDPALDFGCSMGTTTKIVAIRPDEPWGHGCSVVEIETPSGSRSLNSLLPQACYTSVPPWHVDRYVMADRPDAGDLRLRIREHGRDQGFVDRLKLFYRLAGPGEQLVRSHDGEIVLIGEASVFRLADAILGGRSVRSSLMAADDTICLELEAGAEVIAAFAAESAPEPGRVGLAARAGRKDLPVTPCPFPPCDGQMRVPPNEAEPEWVRGDVAGGILVDERASDGTWRTLGWIRPRDRFEEILVPLTAGDDAGANWRHLRLRWRGRHRLDRLRVVAILDEHPELRELPWRTAERVVSREDRSMSEPLRGTLDSIDRRVADVTPTSSIRVWYRWPPDIPDPSGLDLVLETVGNYGSPQRTANAGAEIRSLPKTYACHVGGSNPFNPSITLTIGVPRASRVDVRVYDVQGRLVKTLVDGMREPGSYRLVWDGKSDARKVMASGVYFARMQAPGFESAVKLVLVR